MGEKEAGPAQCCSLQPSRQSARLAHLVPEEL